MQMYFSALLFLARGKIAIGSLSATPTHPLSFIVSLPVHKSRTHMQTPGAHTQPGVRCLLLSLPMTAA